MRRAGSSPQRGLSLVDVVVGLGVSAIVALISVTYFVTANRSASQNQDRVFAFAKAQALIEELRSVAESSDTVDAAELDRFDDGDRINYTLTLQTRRGSSKLVAPDAAASGNRRVGDHWRYARRISVRPLAAKTTRDLRIVTVRVFRVEDETDAPGTEIASLSSIVRTLSRTDPPTQVFDVFLVAIENVPGWWVNLGALQPFVESSLNDVMARNPGLELRLHWITKLGYGRNPQYTPYINEAGDSTEAIPSVYFYPGRLPDGSAALHYYVADRIKARLNVDGRVRNAWDAKANPVPYALADQFNHTLRYPQELALFQARVAAGLEDPAAPTLRILLERLNSDPDAYHNALIVNLHGELLPLPPMRNFSDAAREPEAQPGVRVVTHPEKLHFTRNATTPASSEDVRFRVYSYKSEPSVGPSVLSVPIVVEVPGIDLTGSVNPASGTATLRVARLRGGVDVAPADGTLDAYAPFEPSPVIVGKGMRIGTQPNEMYARVYYAEPVGSRPGTTVIELHGSPLVAPAIGARGLAAADRLYGMEYIPCSTEAAGDFSEDLSSNVAEPKNTARWTITIPAAMLGSSDRRIDVTTRVGYGDGLFIEPDRAAFATGVMYPPEARNEPENASTTYAWWSTSREFVPFTERFQFLGDPRHCPYADLKSNGTSFPNGYNWYHDDFQAGSTNALSHWPGFDAARIKNDSNTTNDGWRGVMEIDVPRAFSLVRNGLVRSETVYTAMTGWSYYYVGIGNEIGYDAANGFPNSIPVGGEPFGDPDSVGFEQSIIAEGSTWGAGVKYVRSSAADSPTTWWGIPWLGELYPDDAYTACWRVPRYEYGDSLPLPTELPAPRGNLPAGDQADQFRRTLRSGIANRLPAGTQLRDATRRTGAEGCTSFFNSGTSSSTFHHSGKDGWRGDMTALGSEVSADYRMPLPSRASISRPFSVAASGDGGLGDEFGYSGDYPRFSVALRNVYYEHDSGATGSALLEVSDPTRGASGYQLVHGIDRTLESGSSFIARFSIATLVHGYLKASDPGLAHPVAPPPRVQVVSPTATTELRNPTTITITWHTSWTRWDDKAYTQSRTAAAAEPESHLQYRVLYSADSGETWRHVADDSVATPGTRPNDSSLLLADLVPGGDESLVWATPVSRVPEGSYLIRVESWRRGASLHLSYHQERVYVQR